MACEPHCSASALLCSVLSAAVMPGPSSTTQPASGASFGSSLLRLLPSQLCQRGAQLLLGSLGLPAMPPWVPVLALVLPVIGRTKPLGSVLRGLLRLLLLPCMLWLSPSLIRFALSLRRLHVAELLLSRGWLVLPRLTLPLLLRLLVC